MKYLGTCPHEYSWHERYANLCKQYREADILNKDERMEAETGSM